MAWELFTNSTVVDPFPAVEELNVRFLFHNGTAGNGSTPMPYPLFGQPSISLKWNDFVAGMNKFAVGSQSQWCAACGNATGVCAAQSSSGSPPAGASGSAGGGGSGISPAVNGVIGAMVTLAVVLAVEALVLLVAGLRVVRKGRGTVGASGAGDGVKA